ncbi:MAG: hypothetical protein P8M53_09835 [Pirellulales bacterium]|nr:hypothetical protein [Pirellulales bacterium]
MHNFTEPKAPEIDSRTITLRAPSRLHFGLLPGTGDLDHRYGGLGVMIDHPNLKMTAQASSRWAVTGLCRDRVERIALQVFQLAKCDPVPVHIHVSDAPPSHVGFGSGTQLTMGTAALLNMWMCQSASLVGMPLHFGRGSRSLVGSEGFVRGGLIFDPGGVTGNDDSLCGSVERYALPTDWRWLLVTSAGEEGLSGKMEVDVFSNRDSNRKLRQQLLDLAQKRLIQSAEKAQFEDFGRALAEYGERCGQLFAHFQAGLYSSSAMEEVANRLKQRGVLGVGQSSWGPTVFGLFPNHESVNVFLSENEWIHHRELVYRVSGTNLSGANILEN